MKKIILFLTLIIPFTALAQEVDINKSVSELTNFSSWEGIINQEDIDNSTPLYRPTWTGSNTEIQPIHLNRDNWKEYKKVIDGKEIYSLPFSAKSLEYISLYNSIKNNEEAEINVVRGKYKNSNKLATPIFEITNLGKYQSVLIPLWDEILKQKTTDELNNHEWCLLSLTANDWDDLDKKIEYDSIYPEYLNCSLPIQNLDDWMYYLQFHNSWMNNTTSYIEAENNKKYFYVEEMLPLTEEEKKEREEYNKRIEEQQKELLSGETNLDKKQEISKNNETLENKAWENNSSNNIILIVVAIIVILIAGCIFYIKFFNKNKND